MQFSICKNSIEKMTQANKRTVNNEGKQSGDSSKSNTTHRVIQHLLHDYLEELRAGTQMECVHPRSQEPKGTNGPNIHRQMDG